MTTFTSGVMFPYGTFPIDPTFGEYYAHDYSRAYSYVLPDRLPHHHPLLRSLSGAYTLHYTLPPWWQACVAQVREEALKPLLATVSAEEFRAGCIEQARWKTFRETLSEAERRQMSTSPKMGALVGDTDWGHRFNGRGPTTTPDRLTLAISTRPLDFLYMSNGCDWTSCQHFQDGCENYRLPGNFYDTGVAVATVRAPDTSVRDGGAILARTTLRVFLHQGNPVMVVGRTYHNNETLALLFLHRLAEILDTQQLPWGFMIDVNALSYCQDGSLGTDLSERCGQPAYVKSDPCWFPSGWYVPYIDGGESDWNGRHPTGDNDYSPSQLQATIRVMRPRVQHPVQIHHALARLAWIGMLPRFL